MTGISKKRPPCDGRRNIRPGRLRVPFDDFDEALALANDHRYGPRHAPPGDGAPAALCSASAPRSLKFLHEVRAGMIKVNAPPRKAPGGTSEPVGAQRHWRGVRAGTATRTDPAVFGPVEALPFSRRLDRRAEYRASPRCCRSSQREGTSPNDAWHSAHLRHEQRAAPGRPLDLQLGDRQLWPSRAPVRRGHAGAHILPRPKIDRYRVVLHGISVLAAGGSAILWTMAAGAEDVAQIGSKAQAFWSYPHVLGCCFQSSVSCTRSGIGAAKPTISVDRNQTMLETT